MRAWNREGSRGCDRGSPPLDCRAEALLGRTPALVLSLIQSQPGSKAPIPVLPPAAPRASSTKESMHMVQTHRVRTECIYL